MTTPDLPDAEPGSSGDDRDDRDRRDDRDAYPSESDVDAVLLEFKGNAREAIAALLHDLARLAEDYEEDVSFGYVRGTLPCLIAPRRV